LSDHVEDLLDDGIDVVAWLVPFDDNDTKRRRNNRITVIPERVRLRRCSAKVGKPGHLHNLASTVGVDLVKCRETSEKPFATRHETDRVQVGAEDTLESGKTLGEVDCATSALLKSRIAANHSGQDFVEPQRVTTAYVSIACVVAVRIALRKIAVPAPRASTVRNDV
jgi:hypothetical protein